MRPSCVLCSIWKGGNFALKSEDFIWLHTTALNLTIAQTSFVFLIFETTKNWLNWLADENINYCKNCGTARILQIQLIYTRINKWHCPFLYTVTVHFQNFRIWWFFQDFKNFRKFLFFFLLTVQTLAKGLL